MAVPGLLFCYNSQWIATPLVAAVKPSKPQSVRLPRLVLCSSLLWRFPLFLNKLIPCLILRHETRGRSLRISIRPNSGPGYATIACVYETSSLVFESYLLPRGRMRIWATLPSLYTLWGCTCAGGLLSIELRLFLPFLIWLFSADESSGFRSSKLQRSSEDTDMTAPQLSNSPQ